VIEGAIRVSCTEIRGHRRETVERTVIEETALAIYVNGRELATLMCTPIALDDLVMGFLMAERIISRPEDVALLRVCLDEGLVRVRLVRPEVTFPERRVLTSGCGSGVTFADLSQQHPSLVSSLSLRPSRVVELMGLMQRSGALFGRAWGLHTSALSDGEALLALAQDVGRHNTIDKVWGECLRRSIATEGRMLLSTGRISSEMLAKAAKMRVPVVASRSSPTSLSLPLAERWGITLIGYVRGQRMDVYTHPERIAEEESPEEAQA